MRTKIAMLTMSVLLPALICAEDGLVPWAANHHPSDSAKQHVQDITTAKSEYVVTQGGTMDGQNCRSPLGVGMSREGAVEQVWESNRAVRMENVGTSDVLDPWLSNGRNNFRSLADIVASTVSPGMTPAEKAHALWHQWIMHQNHDASGNDGIDPVRVINVYGANACGPDAICMAGIWQTAGLQHAAVRTMSHCISQVFYDDRWHLMDGDLHTIYLMRDNETVAGELDVVRDHDLIKRTHTEGILLPETRGHEESTASMYVYDGPIAGKRSAPLDTKMKMVLRPGESLVWRWGHVAPLKYSSGGGPLVYPDRVANGLWEYRPGFANDLWKKGAEKIEGVKSTPDGLSADGDSIGTIVWAMNAPYPFVGGRLETEGSGAEFSLSWDGNTWEPATANLDKFFPPSGTTRYAYRIRCQLKGTASLKRLAIINELQMATLALPEMGVGKNTFVYTDQSPAERNVRITHEWIERSASKPPLAPSSATYPPDNGEANGTEIVFQWTPPSDPDGDKIADYHFELSSRADMKWPLSMSFSKLISRTSDAGQAKFTLPLVGLLTADVKYFWHVRAKDDKGVWGPWGKTWTFIPRGANCPLEPVIDYDQAKNTGILRWKPNPSGRKAVKYRVYGSDEQGFSISDKPYQVNVGSCKELTNPFPGNFITETTAPELALLGNGSNPEYQFRTYYRVVAVDEKGLRSGPSDFATAPRPIIFSKPVLTGKAGTVFRYQVLANRSLGQLKERGGNFEASFWDIEKPAYVLEKAPPWLTIDASSGTLQGTPDAAGKFDVVVTATIDQEIRKLDERTAEWGNEKVVSTSHERIGSSTQHFTIEVAP